MILSNAHLFELLNAGAQPAPLMLAFARFTAQWLIMALPVVAALLWLRGDHRMRLDLLHVALSGLIALGIAQLIGLAWPSPRPFALHMGYQYLAHVDDPGLPSDHVMLIWAIALATLSSARGSWLVFPLLTIGLLVGWARVYLGVHFPFDVAAALPVAALGAAAAWGLSARLEKQMAALLKLYDACESAVLHFLHRE
ncbi:Putative undecaprenyl-diphosphatase YbjG [Variovorax sp. SRS16]|uniref:undecaprenyl-diphosphatase n=1 Tax=Variovorax sp. SRS16 TaxID=282217 RepID=UPI001316EBF4|nr:undecaprenyl-diphosphatase [Variovorax sp. SRS16]VTU33140.1 Putative undecaprenyl-diphosphatase YbjG [Variovorax sp. SRS16]